MLSSWDHGELCSLMLNIVFFKVTIVFSGGFLILLVLRHQIVHVGLGFRKLHLVHTFSSIPVEESLSSEHGCKLFTDSLEEFLDCSRVANEGSRHRQIPWWDITNGCLDVVGDPFDEVGRILILNLQH